MFRARSAATEVEELTAQMGAEEASLYDMIEGALFAARGWPPVPIGAPGRRAAEVRLLHEARAA